MAEIRIQRRRRRGAWAWLIVLVLPFAYLLYWGTARRRTAVVDASADTGAAALVIPRDTVAPPNPIAVYAAYLSKPDTATSDPAARLWAGGALSRLADALATLSGAGAPSNVRALERVRNTAAALSDSRANAPAVSGEQLRGAATAASDVMQTAQRAAYPTAGEVVARVRSAAGGIRTTVPVAAQRANLLRFFIAARDALQAMAPTGNVARAQRAP